MAKVAGKVDNGISDKLRGSIRLCHEGLNALLLPNQHVLSGWEVRHRYCRVAE